MKKTKSLLIFAFSLVTILSSCTDRKELYQITDNFIETLSTKSSYSVFESGSNKKVTSDNRYQVMPTGRLIIVKFLNSADNKNYDELKKDLLNRYSGDKRVNDVYINQGGTVVIDCRN
jgi:hypothetical protein